MGRTRRRTRGRPAPALAWALRWGVLLVLAAPASQGQVRVVDLAAVAPGSEGLYRLRGSAGDGSFGVPVAGGVDADGDGFPDTAMAAQRASPAGRTLAGIVFLVFGDGTLASEDDSGEALAHVLRIHGEGVQEHTGSEIWMDDVTGDGVGDLLIARQNYSELDGRIGAGALTIVRGGPELAQLAASSAVLDLAAPPPGVGLTSLVGRQALGRLGIWMRTGDLTGDGVADIAVGADQVGLVDVHAGEVYVLRGGPWLADAGTIDLADFGATPLAGHVMRVAATPGTGHQHFGATVQVGDLDGNGVAELMVAATLNRVGAQQVAVGQTVGTAHGSGGLPDGRVYIVWDDNFTGQGEPPLWPAGRAFDVDAAPEGLTTIQGAFWHRSFGEEMLPGADFDGDGELDLFVGDLAGNLSGEDRSFSGTGELIYGVARFRDRAVDLQDPPADYAATRFLGAATGDIAADTAALGDFDADGRTDLAFSAPDADPLGRGEAGRLWIFPGSDQRWPAEIDLADPLPASLEVVEVIGAFGTVGIDAGDTLAYSAAAGDLDGDGRTDLIVNEMRGRGADPGEEDVGNLLVLGATLLPEPVGGAAMALLALAALARRPARRGAA